ncbi:MAG: methyltransferase domain-containing protein, partial [Spirochaetia bacterium]|nr:methyltransferase domain-containing protein [Spirochaetia bacterium]
RESAAKVGLANAQFLRGYAHEIPLETETADVVISNCVINHAPDKTAVFKEIRRVLKPDGRFVISDVVAEQDIPEPIRTDPDAVAACYGGAETKSKYFEALSRAGFHHIDILEESEPYRKGPVDVRSITVRGYKNGSGGLQPGR